MSVKHAVFAGAILTLCAAVDAAPASAQSPNCGDIYRALYQTAPQSPEYAHLYAAYNNNCLGGPSARPAYPSFDAQDYPTNYQPPSYGYAEPDYPYYGGYGYAAPVAVGLGLGFGRGFHHDGGLQRAGFHNNGGSHGGGHGGEGRGGDHHEHH
jgi:hypothetical protein